MVRMTPPPSRHGAGCDANMAGDDDPPRHVEPTFGIVQPHGHPISLADGRKQPHRDDAHGLLGIVQSVPQGVGCGREEPQLPGGRFHRLAFPLPDNPESRQHQANGQEHAHQWQNHDEHGHLEKPGSHQPRHAGPDGRRSGNSTDEGMGNADGQSESSAHLGPDRGSNQSADHQLRRHDFGVHHPLSDGRRDLRFHKGHCCEVEESRPGNGPTRRKNAGRDHGGDGVGRVVHPVEEVEHQRQQNPHNHDGRHLEDLYPLCSITIPSTT